MVMIHKAKGKFQPKWEGPFVVESVDSNGAYRLINPEGDLLMMSINGKFLKNTILDHVNIKPLIIGSTMYGACIECILL